MSRISEEQKNKAIEAYRSLGNMTAAAKTIGMNRETLRREMQRSRIFKKSMEEAYVEYCEKWELILEERARQPKADLLLMFKLKAMFPDKYRERVDHKVDTNIRVISGIPRPEKEDTKEINKEVSTPLLEKTCISPPN